MTQVNGFDPERQWSVDTTDTDIDNTTPYATCPVKRFADTDPLKVLVRTYAANGRGQGAGRPGHRGLAQQQDRRQVAYKRLVRWYSDCQHPRVQLVDSYIVDRPFGDFQILPLRSHCTPVRTFTVGFSHSGNSHQHAGARGRRRHRARHRDIRSHAQRLGVQLCADSGGECTDDINVMRAEPPPYVRGPCVPRHRRPPADRRHRQGLGRSRAVLGPRSTPQRPSATRRLQRRRPSAKSKVFVIPQAKELPKEFGVAETVGRFADEKRPRLSSRRSAHACRGLRREEAVGRVDQTRTLQDLRLRRHGLAHRPRGDQGQPGLLPHGDRPPRPRCRPGDVHPGRVIRHRRRRTSPRVAARAGSRLALHREPARTKNALPRRGWKGALG